MPSRNRKKRSKQRAKYLQKQDDILSQDNKAKARARYKADPERRRPLYKADPEKKKASVRDSYKADPEKKKASVCDSYNADIESKQSAKRQRYQEDVEENCAAKRQRYEDNSAAIKASERNRYWNDPAVRLAKRAAERQRYRGGHRTATTTQSYSLYEPKSHALMEYNGGLEKAILRDIDLNGRCVVAEEIGDRDKDTMRPLKWKCTNECRKLTSEEVELVVRTKSLFQMSIEDLRAGLDGLDSGCSHVHTDITLKLHSGFIEQLGHPIYYGICKIFEEDSEDEVHPPTPLPFTQPPPLPPLLEAVLPPYHPPPAVAAALSPPPAAAELPPPAVAAGLPPPPAAGLPPPPAAAELPPPAVAAGLPPTPPALAPPPAPIPVPPTTTSPAAPLAAATTTHMAPMATTRPPHQ
eukprot:Em0003g439a